jgi:hypothetical protein
VAVAAARPVGVAATLVPGPAQEFLDLGLQRGLEHQPHAEPGDILKDQDEVTARSEQLVDLGADALDRRYSSCHGCRSSLVLGGSREPTPVAHLHQGPDATLTWPTEPDRQAALDAGAHDTLTKPFGMGQLLHHLQALRTPTHSPQPGQS